MNDPMKSMTWRTKIGWNIVAGFNDKIDFNLAGAKVATLTAGNYATGTAMATQIQTALTAAYGTGTWTVTYSSSTYKFTITHSTTAFTLLPVTGANATTTALTDLGWAADTSSATTQTSTAAVYQSRAYIKVDFGSALAVSAACLAGIQTLTANASIKIQGNSSDSWSSPAYTATITSANQYGDAITHWPASSQTYRYWRIVISDPFRSSGYLAVGILFLGAYIELSQAPNNKGVVESYDRYSRVQISDSGGFFIDAKTPGLTQTWQFDHISDAEKVNLQTMDNAVDHQPIFYILDPVNAPTRILYGPVMVGSFTHAYGGGSSAAYWSVPIVTKQQLQ